MKTLYPSLLKIFSLIMAVILTGVVNGQDKVYASVKKQIFSSYTSDRSVIMDPVVKIRARTDKKIVLNWAPYKGGVSHYVLERSTDGRSFQEVGVFFAEDWGDDPEYVYADRLSSSYLGPLFYRLRVVGYDGNEIYSPFTTINAECQ